MSRTVTSEQVERFAVHVKAAAGLSKLNLSNRSAPNELCLGMMMANPDQREQGKGTQAMQMLTEFADRHALLLTLSPDVASNERGTTSRSRLVSFYKRFGFVENKSQRKDFALSEAVYRPAHPFQERRS